MKKISRALIIDDERLARAKLRSMLAQFSSVEITGEADCAVDAIKLIETLKPDIIFLDIQMPQATGFDLLEQIDTNAKIIFVTAFDEYAIRAFEINALDYLLKPISPERLKQTIERLSEPQNEIEKELESDDFLFVNTGRQSKFIRLNSITHILAADVYSEVFTKTGEKFLLLKSLSEWEQKLPRNFIRIHRSTIINLDFVARVENYSSHVYLHNIPQAFIISRRYKAKLKDRFG